MSGAQGRFDGGQVRERIIRTRVNAALSVPARRSASCRLPCGSSATTKNTSGRRSFTIRNARRNGAPEARETHNGYDLFGNRFV